MPISTFSVKNCLHQYHVQHRSPTDTEKCVLFPFMDPYDKQNCDCLRQPVSTARRHILEAIDHKKTDCRIRKNRPQIFDKLRWIFSFRKDNKRYKTCRHCSKNNCCDCNNCLCRCHRHFASASIVFLLILRSAVKQMMINAIAGTMKLLLPKTRRQITGQISPTSAGR